jgi:5-(carboxyamino)imidazole ribonucleotide mutase
MIGKTKTEPKITRKCLMLIGIVMGSKSDWPTMNAAVSVFEEFGVPFETEIISAHRTPQRLYQYAEEAKGRLEAIIAGAGGAAHLPGMLAAITTVPVLGVPIETLALRGIDSLLSIVQMPSGVGVATFSIGHSGAANAAFFVIQWLARTNPELQRKIELYRQIQREAVLESRVP